MRPDPNAHAAASVLPALADEVAAEHKPEIEIVALDDARFDVATMPEVKFDVAVVPAPRVDTAARLGKPGKAVKASKQVNSAKPDDTEKIGTPAIAGGGEDRLRYLAMVAATSVPQLRQLQAPRGEAVTAVAPRTRAECERRCGSDGFCDPSSASGCGGEYCLPGRDLV